MLLYDTDFKFRRYRIADDLRDATSSANVAPILLYFGNSVQLGKPPCIPVNLQVLSGDGKMVTTWLDMKID